MNFGTITALVVNMLMQRGTDAIASTTGQPPDLTLLLADLTAANDLSATVGAALVNLGHTELQVRHDFECMDLALTAQAYTTGGLALAASVKRPYAVYYSGLGSAGQAVRGRPIWPANKMDVERIRLAWHRAGSPAVDGVDGDWHRGSWFPGGTSVLDVDPGRTCWWLQGNNLVVGHVDCADDSALAGALLWLDTYSALPDYAAAAASDWFSVWGPGVLIYQSAALCSMVGWEDERAERWQEMADARAEELMAMDRRRKAGGQAELVVPAARGYRMRR